MIEIRNLLFQPLTFQLLGVEEGLHIHSREIRQVEDENVSEEMLSAERMGFVELRSVDKPDKPGKNNDASILPEEPIELPVEEPVQSGEVPPAPDPIEATEEPVATEPAMGTEEPVMMAAMAFSEVASESIDGADVPAETTDSADMTTTRRRR